MEEPALRDALATYVNDEPPLSLGVETVLRAGRRSRRRVAAVRGGAGLAAVTAAVLAVTLLPDLGGPVVVAPGSTSNLADQVAVFCGGSPPPAPVWDGPADVAWSLDTDRVQAPGIAPLSAAVRDAAAARLTCALLRQVGPRLPGVRWGQTYYAPRSAAPLQFYVRTDDPAFYATAAVVDGAGVGGLGLTVYPTTEEAVEQTAATCQAPDCTAQVGPGGELVLVEASRGAARSVDVTVYMGRTAVRATANVYDERRPSVDASRQTARSAPPLGVNELLAIAADPGFDVFS